MDRLVIIIAIVQWFIFFLASSVFIFSKLSLFLGAGPYTAIFLGSLSFILFMMTYFLFDSKRLVRKGRKTIAEFSPAGIVNLRLYERAKLDRIITQNRVMRKRFLELISHKKSA